MLTPATLAKIEPQKLLNMMKYIHLLEYNLRKATFTIDSFKANENFITKLHFCNGRLGSYSNKPLNFHNIEDNPHKAEVLNLIAADLKRLFVVSIDRLVYLWDFNSNPPTKQLTFALPSPPSTKKLKILSPIHAAYKCGKLFIADPQNPGTCRVYNFTGYNPPKI